MAYVVTVTFLKQKPMDNISPCNFIIKLVVFPYDIYVSVDESDEVLSQALISLGVKEEDFLFLMNMRETTSGRYDLLKSNQSVIRIKSCSDKYTMIDTIAHESLHAVTFIFDHMGLELKLDISDEAYAYAIGYVTSEICRRLNL